MIIIHFSVSNVHDHFFFHVEKKRLKNTFFYLKFGIVILDVYISKFSF